MKKLAIWILALCCGTTLFAARGKTTPHGWFDDYEAARKKARNENKQILVLFTGSDWCGFCIKLRKNVLDKTSFKSFARKNLVLVYADSPKHTKLSKHLVEQNKMLRRKLAGSSGGVPHTVIITPDEEILGNISGCPKDPKDYLKQLSDIVRSRPRGGARDEKPDDPRDDGRVQRD